MKSYETSEYKAFFRDNALFRRFYHECYVKELDDDVLVEQICQQNEFSESYFIRCLMGVNFWEFDEDKMLRFMRERYHLDPHDCRDVLKVNSVRDLNDITAIKVINYKNGCSKVLGAWLSLSILERDPDCSFSESTHLESEYYFFRREQGRAIDQADSIREINWFLSNEFVSTSVIESISEYLKHKHQIDTIFLDSGRDAIRLDSSLTGGKLKEELLVPLAALSDHIRSEATRIKENLPNDENGLTEAQDTLNFLEKLDDDLDKLELEIERVSNDTNIQQRKIELYSRVEALCSYLVGRERAQPLVDTTLIGACFAFLSLCGMPPVFAAPTAMGAFAGPKMMSRIQGLLKKNEDDAEVDS